MVNHRVDDLDAMLGQLSDAGATVDNRVEDHANGRFGWAVDPEGDRFELREPKPPKGRGGEARETADNGGPPARAASGAALGRAGPGRSDDSGVRTEVSRSVP